jgi:hypothetical protein
MKRFPLLLGLLATIVVPGLPAADSAPTAQAPLQVEVSMPASMNPIHDDDVAEVLVDSIRDAFRKRGYKGKIEEVRRPDEPAADRPLVTIRLTEWRRNRTGGVDCTFTAAIRPAHGAEQSLGLFTATELGLGINNRWQLGEAFRDSAERAADDLYRRLAKMDAVPGVGPVAER